MHRAMIHVAYGLLMGFGGVAAQAPVKPDAVIVFIADGAGVGHWTLAKLASDSLAIRRMPVAGLMDTRGQDHEVTGSAPGATAIATGVRTRIGAVGVGPEGDPRETVLELAHRQGWRTGLVTTTLVTDATPAAFASHVRSRRDQVEIFEQMLRLPVHVLLGGGTSLFDLARENGSGHLLSLVNRSYTYVANARELRLAAENDRAMLMGLFAPGEMARAAKRSPGLKEMTWAALEVMEGVGQGLFLMVESEGSDTEAHNNTKGDVLAQEMLAFDDAVGVALDYYDRHPNTLILVTADHETGGVYLKTNRRREAVLDFGSRGHTGALVPLFAIGPGAERFGGLHDNDEVGRILMDLVRR